MKASKQLKKQFADFAAEFATLATQFGGMRDERRELAGPGSAFLISCGNPRYGIMRASIHEPWDFEGNSRQSRNYSSAAIYLSFTGEDVPTFADHWKWNIHRSTSSGGMYVECCNEALTEFAKRLKRATEKPLAQAA